MIRKVVDQGTGGDKSPDVQVALTGQGEDEEQEKAGGKERWKGEGGGKKQGKTWILVETTSQGTKREQ